MAADTSGRLLVAVPAFKDGKGSLLVLGSRETVGWRIHELEMQSFVGYTAALAIAGDSVVIGYIDGEGVWLMYSADWGRTWGRPVRVTPPTGQPIMLQLVRVGDELHALWGEVDSGSIRVTALRHAFSADRGSTWSAVDSLSFSRGISRIHSIVGPCGIDVIGDDYSGADHRGSVFYARWAGQWTHVRRLFDGYASQDADIRIRSDGSPIIAALIRPLGSDTVSFTAVISSGKRN